MNDQIYHQADVEEVEHSAQVSNSVQQIGNDENANFIL